MAFVPKTLDYTVSPYTGLTRQSWIEAGMYLLQGVFQNIAHFEDPVVMPRLLQVTCTSCMYKGRSRLSRSL